MPRIGGQLPFRQLENCMALVKQPQLLLNLAKNADAIVPDHHFHRHRRPRDRDGDRGTVGVIQGVVEHLGKPVLPDTSNVFCQHSEDRIDLPAPDDVFGQVLVDAVRLIPLEDGCHFVDPVPRVAALAERSLLNQPLEMAVDCLPAHTKPTCRQRSDIVGVLLNVLENVAADRDTPGSDATRVFTHNHSLL